MKWTNMTDEISRHLAALVYNEHTLPVYGTEVVWSKTDGMRLWYQEVSVCPLRRHMIPYYHFYYFCDQV